MSTRRNKVAEVGAAWLALANSERAEVISTLRVAHRMGKGFPAALAIIRAVEIAAAEPEVKDMPESPDCYSCNPNSGGQCLDMIGENCPCPCHADHFAGTGNKPPACTTCGDEGRIYTCVMDAATNGRPCPKCGGAP